MSAALTRVAFKRNCELASGGGSGVCGVKRRPAVRSGVRWCEVRPVVQSAVAALRRCGAERPATPKQERIPHPDCARTITGSALPSTKRAVSGASRRPAAANRTAINVYALCKQGWVGYSG